MLINLQMIHNRGLSFLKNIVFYDFTGECEPTVKKCEYYQNRAPLKTTYMVHWMCDGEDDCGNGFDEANCPGNRLC